MDRPAGMAVKVSCIGYWARLGLLVGAWLVLNLLVREAPDE